MLGAVLQRLQLGLAALLLVAPALATAPAQGAIFWANKYEDTIGRANLDGSGVDQAFVAVGAAGTHPVGLAVDGTHIYWSGFEAADAIGRARLDGSAVEPAFVTGAADPVGVAVDERHVYWANSATGTIGRAPLAGGPADQAFLTGLGTPYGLAVASGRIYWSDHAAGTIGRAGTDGSAVETGFLAVGGAPTAVAVDGSHILWVDDRDGTDSGADVIGRAGLDGGGADPGFISGAVNPWGIAVDHDHVYWTSQGPAAPPFPKHVARADLSGQAADHEFVDGVPTGIYGVAVTPLETVVTGGPEGLTRSSRARFELGASEPAQFECRLEPATFEACTTPLGFAGLRDGRHTLRVRAVSAGGADPSPTARTWTVDATAPRLRRLRLSPRRLVPGRRTRLRYRLSEPAVVRFRVRRRGGRRLPGTFSRPEGAGRQVVRWAGRLRGARLEPGRYVLAAVATDPAGNRSRRARSRFEVLPQHRRVRG
jgi:hypothetical protein